MSVFSVADILRPTTLLPAYKKQSSLFPQSPLMAYYGTKAAVRAYGETFEFAVFEDSRQASPINRRGAPAKTMQPVGASKKTLTTLHYFNELEIPAASVEFLREENAPGIQEKGVVELGRQMEVFARRHMALKEVCLAHAFRGALYFDSDDLPLESSSGARTTVDLGVAATHKSQLNHASAGADIIGTAWDNAAASILTDLEQIREAAEYDKVPMPKHVWLHSVAKPWILANTEIKAFVQNNNPQADVFLRTFAGGGDMLSLGDWTFHFTNATYVGADGSTVRPLIPKTAAIITPDVNDGDWFVNIEGPETIPTEDGVIGSLNEYFGKTQVVYGDFAYARINDNPLSVAVRVGCNFLWAFKDPNAVWYPTVDF